MTPEQLLQAINEGLPPSMEVHEYLDRGGQGAVFKGTVDGDEAVLKLIHSLDDPRRIQREIELLESIASPHLVSLKAHANIEVDGQNYPVIAYEFIGGGDLRRFLADEAASVDSEWLVKLGSHVSIAIETLWKREDRIVHRDVKPANILLASSGDFVLADVGIARHVDRTSITARGGWGTPGYMSPEQAKGRRALTINSDVFSLGVTLYEIAAKKHPFARDQNNIGLVTPPALLDERDDLPKKLADLIHQMIRVRPAQRPSNPREQFARLGGE